MSIPIKNSLLSVCIHLGSVEDEENNMRMLLDTGAAMNSGNLTYHLWVMSQYPEIVVNSYSVVTARGMMSFNSWQRLTSIQATSHWTMGK